MEIQANCKCGKQHIFTSEVIVNGERTGTGADDLCPEGMFFCPGCPLFTKSSSQNMRSFQRIRRSSNRSEFWPRGFDWSRVRESNPPSRLGKPLYYRYTNPAYQWYYSRAQGKFQPLFVEILLSFPVFYFSYTALRMCAMFTKSLLTSPPRFVL